MKLKIEDEISKSFEERGEEVEVNRQKTIELHDYFYALNNDDVHSVLMNWNPSPPTVHDSNERFKIFEYFLMNAEKFLLDKHTRRVVFQPKYEDEDNVASCMSCIQMIIRDNKLITHVFMRSQNFKSNFHYDITTLSHITTFVKARLAWYNIENVQLYVNVISLHCIV